MIKHVDIIMALHESVLNTKAPFTKPRTISDYAYTYHVACSRSLHRNISCYKHTCSHFPNHSYVVVYTFTIW